MKYRKYIFILIFIIISCIGIFLYLNSLNEVKLPLKFSEEEILGMSEKKVIQKYGDFDRYYIRKNRNNEIVLYCGLYKIGEKKDWGPCCNVYYQIYFDKKDGVVVYTEIGTPFDEL